MLAAQPGTGLLPLTTHRAQSAVPFGGVYRFIDFTLSNLVNSGYFKIVVLTQYKSYSLHRHLATAWRLPAELGRYVLPVPAQQRRGKTWYQGSADAIYQSLNVIDEEPPGLVIVAEATRVGRIDFSQIVKHHLASGAPATTVVTGPPTRTGGGDPNTTAASTTAADRPDPGRQPTASVHPKKIPVSGGDRQQTPAGVYVFDTATLKGAVTRDARRPGSRHDLGRDVIPDLAAHGLVNTYELADTPASAVAPSTRAYDLPVDTLDSYFSAHLDLLTADPVLELANERWPIYAHEGHHPPARLTRDRAGQPGTAIDSIISSGVTIIGAHVDHSVLSPDVRIHGDSTITQSVVFTHVRIGRHCTIHRAIIDNDVIIEDAVSIGIDHEHDRARGFHVTDTGIVVLSSRQHITTQA